MRGNGYRYINQMGETFIRVCESLLLYPRILNPFSEAYNLHRSIEQFGHIVTP